MFPKKRSFFGKNLKSRKKKFPQNKILVSIGNVRPAVKRRGTDASRRWGPTSTSLKCTFTKRPDLSRDFERDRLNEVRRDRRLRDEP